MTHDANCDRDCDWQKAFPTLCNIAIVSTNTLKKQTENRLTTFRVRIVFTQWMRISVVFFKHQRNYSNQYTLRYERWIKVCKMEGSLTAAHTVVCLMRSQLIVLTAVKETCAFHIAILAICFHIYILIFTHSHYELATDFVAVPERPCSAKTKPTTKNWNRFHFGCKIKHLAHNMCMRARLLHLRRMCGGWKARIQYHFYYFLFLKSLVAVFFAQKTTFVATRN